MSTSACGASSVIHVVPGPWAATTMSTVPSDGSTRWIEKQRRRRLAEVGPPTASATNCPGRAGSATPGAANVRCRYAPTRRLAMSSPVTWTTPLRGAARRGGRGHRSPVTANRSSAFAWSCSEVTRSSPVRRASIPCTAAASSCTVVMMGLSALVVAARIS